MMELTPQERVHLDFLLARFRNDPKVQEMKNYIQHGTITTYEHCERVTELAFLLNRRWNLGADEKTLVTGAFLHDFYLYDWHAYDDGEHQLHGFFHPGKAVKNAKKYFQVTEKEEEIIRNHMWPLTLTRMPMSKEAWIVCMADKCVSTRETLMEQEFMQKKRKNRASKV